MTPARVWRSATTNRRGQRHTAWRWLCGCGSGAAGCRNRLEATNEARKHVAEKHGEV